MNLVHSMAEQTVHLAMNAPDDALTYTLDIQSGEFDFSGDDTFFRKIRVGEHAIVSSFESKNCYAYW